MNELCKVNGCHSQAIYSNHGEGRCSRHKRFPAVKDTTVVDNPAIDLDALEATAKAATPGPRRWEVNRSYHKVTLQGGEPRFDMSILRFSRWGMAGATVEFVRGAKPYVCDGFDKAQDVAVAGFDRRAMEMDIDNPDAQFIAAFDPETALALIDAARRTEDAEIQYARLQEHLRPLCPRHKQCDEAECRAAALTDALEVMVADKIRIENGHLMCKCGAWSKGENRLLLDHRGGCPVPAAEQAIALGLPKS